MARPERNSVDYFPFICEDGKKMYYIEETYGNDGFATFVKILRELAKTEYHYLDLSQNTTLMFLSAKCKITKDTLVNIINDLCDLGKFDSTLWNENKIIWCQDFIDSIQDAYFKRKNNCITYDGLLSLLISKGVRKPIKSKLKVPVKPQIKEEYIKEEENKEFIYREFKHLKLTVEEFERIEEEYHKKDIDDVLDSIENYVGNKKYISLNLTCRNWLKKYDKKTDTTKPITGRTKQLQPKYDD